ncbi:PD-(D/E)XK motif protein [Thermodesulfobacteriota bacterium]
MADEMQDKLRTIWQELEKDQDQPGSKPGRRYRRVELEKEVGFRLSCYLPGRLWEMLIEVSPGKRTLDDREFPSWSGMKFELLPIDVPEEGARHICLRLEKSEHRNVFVTVCADLARDLQDLSLPEERERAVLVFFDRWTRFFERYSIRGMSAERQRGLYGELWWLKRLINEGISSGTSLGSWKGCERGYHDFEIEGHVVEVKTTLTKEPRKVQINNERQLDERGLICLHLLVVSLIQSEGGGETLPDLILELKTEFASSPSLVRRFETCLREVGYLEIHADLYDKTYTVKKGELFKVQEGFPRIIEVPAGLGNLRYSLVVGACISFLENVDEYMKNLKKGILI